MFQIVRLELCPIPIRKMCDKNVLYQTKNHQSIEILTLATSQTFCNLVGHLVRDMYIIKGFLCARLSSHTISIQEHMTKNLCI